MPKEKILGFYSGKGCKVIFQEEDHQSVIFNVQSVLMATSLKKHNLSHKTGLKVSPEKLFYLFPQGASFGNFYFYEVLSKDVKAIIGSFEFTSKDAIKSIHSMGDVINKMEVVSVGE